MHKEYCSIAVQTDDFGCEHGCTSQFISDNLSLMISKMSCQALNPETDPDASVKSEEHFDCIKSKIGIKNNRDLSTDKDCFVQDDNKDERTCSGIEEDCRVKESKVCTSCDEEMESINEKNHNYSVKKYSLIDEAHKNNENEGRNIVQCNVDKIEKSYVQKDQIMIHNQGSSSGIIVQCNVDKIEKSHFQKDQIMMDNQESSSGNIVQCNVDKVEDSYVQKDHIMIHNQGSSSGIIVQCNIDKVEDSYVQKDHIMMDNQESSSGKTLVYMKDVSPKIKEEPTNTKSCCFDKLPNIDVGSVVMVKVENFSNEFSYINDVKMPLNIVQENDEEMLVNVEHRFNYNVITESHDFPSSPEIVSAEEGSVITPNKATVLNAVEKTQAEGSQCHEQNGQNGKEDESMQSLSGENASNQSAPLENNSDISSQKQPNPSKPPNQFKCLYCQKNFKYKFLLNDHMLKHTGERKFECSYCHKRFPRREAFKDHIRLHTGEKPFHCVNCDQYFSSYNYLFKHQRKEHPNEKSHLCSYCKQTFFSKMELNKHIHDEKHLSCTECGKTFSTPSVLKQHVLIHSGEKPFICEYCEKKFSLKKKLNEHLKVHTGKNAYDCSVCGKRFTGKVNFDRHVRIHTGEKPYKCPNCEKSFAEQSNLNRHLTTHTGEKKISCEICGKRFARPSYLQLHLRTHTGERPYECPHCDLKFKGRSNMRRHMLRKHSEKVS